MQAKRFITFITVTTIFCAGSYASSSAQIFKTTAQAQTVVPVSHVSEKASHYTKYADMSWASNTAKKGEVYFDDYEARNSNVGTLDLTQNLEDQNIVNPSKPLVYKFDAPTDYNVLMGVKPRPKDTRGQENITLNEGVPKTRYIAPVKLTAGILISRKF